jgi:hypothetical protein
LASCRYATVGVSTLKCLSVFYQISQVVRLVPRCCRPLSFGHGLPV